MFDITPMKTTIGVTNFLGAFVTTLVIKALIYPLFSATPTPSIATKTGPSATKVVKCSTTPVKIKRIPSVVSKLITSTVSSSRLPVSGFIPV